MTKELVSPDAGEIQVFLEVVAADPKLHRDRNLGKAFEGGEWKFLDKSIQRLWAVWRTRARMDRIDAATVPQSLAMGLAIHPKTLDLVWRFAQALVVQLGRKEREKSYLLEWQDPRNVVSMRREFHSCVQRGDTLSAAAYLAFLFDHNASTLPVPADLLSAGWFASREAHSSDIVVTSPTGFTYTLDLSRTPSHVLRLIEELWGVAVGSAL